MKKVWVEAVKNTSSMKNESNVKEFFSTQVDKSYQFLDEAICVCFTDVVKEQDRGDVVYKMLDIIMVKGIF